MQNKHVEIAMAVEVGLVGGEIPRKLVTWCRRDEGAANFRRLILHIVQEQFSVGVRSNALMK